MNGTIKLMATKPPTSHELSGTVSVVPCHVLKVLMSDLSKKVTAVVVSDVVENPPSV